MAKDDFKHRRRLVAAKHNPPLVHVSEVAKILDVSAGAARYQIDKHRLREYSLPRPFARGPYYEIAAVQALAKELKNQAHNHIRT